MRMKLFAGMLALCFAAFSCTKEDNDPPPAPEKVYQLPGLYIGTYTVTQLPGLTPLRYVFAIEPDGTVTTEGLGADGKTYYHQGTWTLTDSTFKATYTTINRTSSVVTQSCVMTFHKKEGTLTDGTWKDVINPEGFIDGKFQTFNRVKDNP